MSVTWQALLAVDVGPVRQAAPVWDKLAATLEDQADGMAANARTLPEVWPSGPASESAAKHLDGMRGELDNAYVPMSSIAQALAEWADGISELKGQARALIDDAERLNITIAADGTISMNEGSANASTAQSMNSVVHVRDGILQRAAELDGRLAGVLAQNTATAAGTPAAFVDPKTIPARGTDPVDVKRWWDSLTPEQQRYLIMNNFEQIGWLDGVPAASRDIANRLALDHAQETSQASLDQTKARQDQIRGMIEQGRIWELYPDASDPMTAAETELMRLDGQRSDLEGKLKGLTAIDNRLEDTNLPRAYLLGVSTEGDGRAIVSVGNPDLADNVLTYVPGTGSDLSKVGGDIERANRMASDANAADRSATTAAVFWLGYDAPDSIPQAGQSGFAEDGGRDLGSFQTGLRATHEGDSPSRNTVLGHSYGSTVIGHGAMSSSISADALVFVGSPGVDVNNADELTGVHPSQVYATRAEHDMIARIPDWDIIHGNDPTRDDFGANVFASDPGDPEDEGATHSKYWDHGNISRRNIAYVATGQPEKLT
ncbi:alpha/beta hydrolase [Micromonospora sp. WMMD1102]|uniref:alpha/beta hydrolase n=1 Tax=Micromonospora sp. WMMD1102 TaxID=3016105 RepID=UPI002414F1B2|nr:alpha/beta hydrolase [Micromonospora sp. WMMD1102]MDG4785455.1 alpha/beta hydrolase [Micromonospora sp. WMMD1102]